MKYAVQRLTRQPSLVPKPTKVDAIMQITMYHAYRRGLENGYALYIYLQTWSVQVFWEGMA